MRTPVFPAQARVPCTKRQDHLRNPGSGLGACTAITLRMYAEHQSWPLAGVNVELTYVVKDRNTRWIDRLITLQGVDEDQRAKLAEIAEKTPVTRVVRAGIEIRTTTGAA